MPKITPLRNCVGLSVLFHLTFFWLVSKIPVAPHRAQDVMIVDLADLPRSTEFRLPQPGILEGARPKPPPPPKPVPKEKPRIPPPRNLVGRVPDLPVNPDLPPEKEFPVPRAEEKPAPPDRDLGPADVAREKEAPRTPASSSPASLEPPASSPPASLREITPSLGKMVMAKAIPRGGPGEATPTGRSVGTGAKVSEKGAISEGEGGGTHLTALNAPEIQYISYFASIKRKIELVWHYPPDAAMAGIQGYLTVDFVIGRDGRLESVELLQGSGHRILDEEALGSIHKAAPYHPIPEQYRIPNLRIRARFIYEMHTLKLR